MLLRILGTAALALVLHLLLGWGWTLGAAVVGGWWAGRHGWLVGAAGLLVSWGALVVYDYASAPGAVGEMLRAMGQILGNLPGAAVVGLTLLIGCLLGVVGGSLGTQLGRVLGRA